MQTQQTLDLLDVKRSMKERAKNIKGKLSSVSKYAFIIITKNIKEPHIANDVTKTAMHEHGCYYI